MFCLKESRPFSLSVSLLLLFVFWDVLIQASCLQFSYFPSIQSGHRQDFLFADNNSNLAYEALQITPDSQNLNLQNASGRVVYKNTFNLRRRNGIIASFNTSFVLNIKGTNGSVGEGLAFILTNNWSLPIDSYGKWLGIVNQDTNGSSSNGIVAIEFDTKKSYPEDLDSNHVGLDVNSIYSFAQFPLKQFGVNLSSGLDVLVSLSYDGNSKNMTLSVSMANDTASNHLTAPISWPIDLSQYLQEDVYIGFSASTGDDTELNCVRSWNFTGSEEEEERDHTKKLLLILLVIPLLFIMFIAVLWWLRRRRARIDSAERRANLELMLADSTRGVRRFRLKELKSATENFDKKNKLGQGGFGEVYKGFLKKTKETVAVKRVTKKSDQSEQQFAAEVMMIGCLSHKNLVKLVGWCFERGELLLVYELLPRGSLDKLLFPKAASSTLSAEEEEVLMNWEIRHKIIHGVASALSYLHHGCRGTILHRDVKASNVMLDSDYTARLGDFGLARIIQHDGITHHTTNNVAGTPGYFPLEYVLTSRASKETDVYGFGVFSMVVATGRSASYHRCSDNSRENVGRGNTNARDGADSDEEDEINNGNGDRDDNLNDNHIIIINYNCSCDKTIVDWVWDLYGREMVLQAADQRLRRPFEEEQMGRVLRLALACCHPNPNERPSMREAVQVLTGESLPPTPPEQKPAFVWPVLDPIPSDAQ